MIVPFNKSHYQKTAAVMITLISTIGSTERGWSNMIAGRRRIRIGIVQGFSSRDRIATMHHYDHRGSTSVHLSSFSSRCNAGYTYYSISSLLSSSSSSSSSSSTSPFSSSTTGANVSTTKTCDKPRKSKNTSTMNIDDVNENRLFSEEINVLYDSKCNVCKLEMEWLVARDVRVNGSKNRKLKITDIEGRDYDESNPMNGKISYETALAAIYAIRYDGSIYKGIPVFELAYDTVGLGWIWKVNNVPIINRFLLWGYDLFAKNRTTITRGSSLEELIRLHKTKKMIRQRKTNLGQTSDGDDDCESCKKLL